MLLQRHRRRPPDQRHHFHRRTPWLRIFADEMRERLRTIEHRSQPRCRRDDESFSDQVEAAELLFAGLEDDWMDYDDDLPPYAGGIEM